MQKKYIYRYINEKTNEKKKYIYRRKKILCEMGCLHPVLHGKCSLRKTNVCSCLRRRKQQVLKKKRCLCLQTGHSECIYLSIVNVIYFIFC